MNRTASRQTVRTTHRTRRASLNPYYMDDIAFTLADILRDRAIGRSARQPLISDFTFFTSRTVAVQHDLHDFLRSHSP